MLQFIYKELGVFQYIFNSASVHFFFYSQQSSVESHESETKKKAVDVKPYLKCVFFLISRAPSKTRKKISERQ